MQIFPLGDKLSKIIYLYLMNSSKQKIHAKVYIFRPANFNEYAPCEVITGSSNLTDSGLGSNPESNYEFNVSLRQFEDVKFATNEKMENCLKIYQTS